MPGEYIYFYIGAQVSSSPSFNTTANLVSATARDISDRQVPVVSAIDVDEIIGIGRRLYLPLIRVYSNNPTPAPFGIFISNIVYQGNQPGESDEYVEIRNSGYSAVNLMDWWISANTELAYFGPVTLQAGHACRVYTNQSTGTNWCGNFESTTPIWNNTSDCGELYNPIDELVSRYCYP
jgi:hypothetical protein